MLDSLDQLTPNDFKHVEKWLLTDLPFYVKFIVSTIPDHGNLLQLITKLICKRFDEQLKLKQVHLADDNKNSAYEDKITKLINRQLLQVTELSPEESETILNKWLVTSKRTLTNEQWNDLRSIFKNGKLLLLFLKLTFDEVFTWNSWSRAEAEFLKCSKIEHIIVYMFKKMEKTHGEIIFRRAICYMTINKNGISDGELEDILSLDDDVLYAVFQFHMPPIRRFPKILWMRIKKDSGQYIIEKEANDSKVIQWHHKKFIEVSNNYYVKQLSQRENEAVYQNIIDFYNENWKGKQKPFQMNEYLKKKYKNVKQTLAERYVTSQPIKYIGSDGKMRYNKRKLTELPNCLANINNAFGLEKACELVYYNYEFMHSKFFCDTINEIDDELKKLLGEDTQATTNSADKAKQNTLAQLKLYQRSMPLCGNLISDQPDCLSFQLTSRLLNYYGVFKHITQFIDDCDRLSPNVCAFISPYMQQHSPGSYLISSIPKHNEPILRVIILNHFFITFSYHEINVYVCKKAPFLVYLFNLKLPDKEKISFYIANVKYKYFKTFVDQTATNSSSDFLTDFRANEVNLNDFIGFKVIAENLVNNKLIEETIDSISNPDLFPVWFLVINKFYTYIIAANRQIKFAYELKEIETSGCEILDVFCLGMKQVVIVEKNSFSIKIFPDLEKDPYKYKVIDSFIIEVIIHLLFLYQKCVNKFFYFFTLFKKFEI